jgi:Transcriptional regulator containing an amidase domain and an AraC-type DNA-binding HTH domain
MAIIAGHHGISMGMPPSPVQVYGAFGESIHGLAGDESFCNGFWVLNLVSGGGGTLEIAGQSFEFDSGCAIIAPPDIQHRYRFRAPTTKTYAHFRVQAGTERAPFPVVQQLGERFEWFRANILVCRGLWIAEPAKARSILWSLLWELADGPAGEQGPIHHPAIRRMLAYVEENLARPFGPDELAAAAGCSVTHLNRLCRAAFGQPVARYVRNVRLERAVHKLTHTTEPVLGIAQEVGIPDLQHFNKLVRAYSGLSPRGLRRREARDSSP